MTNQTENLQVSSSQLHGLCPVDSDNTNGTLPADRTDVHLPSAGHTRAYMAAVVEQRVLLFAVADLTQVHLLVCYFPVADTLPVSLAIFVPAHVPVARLVFDVRPLAVPLVIHPVPFICIARWIYHYALAVALAEDKVPLVCRGRVREVFAFTVVMPFVELSTVIVSGESGFDGTGAGEGVNWVIP